MQKLDFTKLSDNEILTISQEDLESLNTEDLEILSTRMQFAADDAHVTEKSLKTMINSLYGALANKFFFIKNPDFAAAITSSGRFFIQLCAERAEEYFQAMTETEKGLIKNNKFVVYGDTDSVVSDSCLHINNKVITIEDFFNEVDSKIDVTPSGCEVKQVKDCLTPTFSIKTGLVQKPVKYVMRHKVKKQMFRIKTKDGFVDVTKDHSIKVLRNDELIDIKPSEIQKGDKIVKLCGI